MKDLYTLAYSIEKMREEQERKREDKMKAEIKQILIIYGYMFQEEEDFTCEVHFINGSILIDFWVDVPMTMENISQGDQYLQGNFNGIDTMGSEPMLIELCEVKSIKRVIRD